MDGLGAVANGDEKMCEDTEPVHYLSFEEMLLCKFPSFDSQWSKEEMLAWFDAFSQLVCSNVKLTGAGTASALNAKLGVER